MKTVDLLPPRRPSGKDVVEKSYVSVSFRNALLLAAVHPCCARVYLGDEDAVVLKQVMVVVATSQQLPDFSSEWLRNAAADQ